MLMNYRLAFLIISFCCAVSSAERLSVQNFGPNIINNYKTDMSMEDVPLERDPVSTAKSFAIRKFGLAATDIRVSNSYQSSHNGVTHVYLKQLVKGIEVENANFNINVDKSGQVLSFGSSFVRLTPELLSKTKLWGMSSSGFAKPAAAMQTLAAFLKKPMSISNIKETSTVGSDGVPVYKLSGISFAEETTAKQSYLLKEDGSILPTWEIVTRLSNNWYHAHVQSDAKAVASLNDWVADASLRVVKLGNNDPVTSSPELINGPENAKASPNGWFDQGKNRKFTTTIGNNVYAQENFAGRNDYLNNKRPDGGANLTFDFKTNLKDVPKTYIDASVTNLFYMNNIIHDLYHSYGFDEVAGNFQEYNFEKGGAEGDAVIANAQDGSGTNNANFATPPDGQKPRMRMYVFTGTPQTDGDLENDIITHEYSHGLSNRLTGGPSNVNCLWSGESGGMGEGWGDFIAILLQMKESDKSDRVMGVGNWVNKGKTIRRYNYTTDKTANPTTYGILNQWREVHQIGEVWANILYEVYWSLMGEMKKFNSDWYSADLESANTLLLRLIVDGMKLQPCNPNFIQARDAILQAENVLTKGKHKCAIWQAFTKRGVGSAATSAGSKVTESFVAPNGC